MSSASRVSHLSEWEADRAGPSRSLGGRYINVVTDGTSRPAVETQGSGHPELDRNHLLDAVGASAIAARILACEARCCGPSACPTGHC